MNPVRIGLISDTHDLLRPQAVEALRGCAHIVHAGDICAPPVLDALRRLAPISAVRGNNDHGPWADALPQTHLLRIEGVAILMVHDLATLSFDPAAAGAQVVVSGHSHRPLIDRRGGLLYVNPGSAGPRRFRLPISVGHLIVRGSDAEASLTTLDP
jgi:putative phosphoesterase